MGDLPDGRTMDCEEGIIAISDVIGAVIPHILRQIDHAKTAVHPAILLSVPDPKPVPLLRQNAKGRPAGKGGQTVSLPGIFKKRQVLYGPDGTIQRRNRGPKGRLLRPQVGVQVSGRSGHNPEAVVGPGAQPSGFIAHMRLRRYPGKRLPVLSRPSLHLKVMALNPVPLQGIKPGTRLLVCKRQFASTGQILVALLHRNGGGTAEDEAPLLPARPNSETAKGRPLLFLPQDGPSPISGGSHRDTVCRSGGEHLICPENLIPLPAAGPREEHRPLLQNAGNLRSLQPLLQNETGLEGLPAVKLPGGSKKRFPVGHSPHLHLQLRAFREAGEMEGRLRTIARLPCFAAGELHLIQRRGIGRSGPVQLHIPAAVDTNQQLPFFNPRPFTALGEKTDRRHQQRQRGGDSRRPDLRQPPDLNAGPPVFSVKIPSFISIPSDHPYLAPRKRRSRKKARRFVIAFRSHSSRKENPFAIRK